MAHTRENSIPLLVVCGPTASGKTALAVHLAGRLGGEVVSADSMQIYRRMDIGTAKPTREEMEGIPHHLLDCVAPSEEFSLAEFLALATGAVADIHGRGKLPVLAGGTGLYLHSLIDNVRIGDAAPDHRLRRQLVREAQERGPRFLWEQLLACDPVLADKLHPNNTGRVIRALEVYRQTGETMSERQRRSRLEPSPYRPCLLGLTMPRDDLYRRIDARVEQMMEAGLEAEARGIWSESLSGTASQAIGYKELFAHFAGDCSLEEAVDRIKQATRRYAKRQLTWLRRDQRIHWLDWAQFTDRDALCREAEAIARGELGL